MLLFLNVVCASWSAEGICLWAFHLFLLLSLSALDGTSLAGPIAWFMAQSPVTSPSGENGSISNLDITQSQIRFGRAVFVCGRSHAPDHIFLRLYREAVRRFAAKLVESSRKPKILWAEGRGKYPNLGISSLSLWKIWRDCTIFLDTWSLIKFLCNDYGSRVMSIFFCYLVIVCVCVCFWYLAAWAVSCGLNL